MYNINSPLVKELIKNIPNKLLGRVGFYDGPPPRVETVRVPSPQNVPEQPTTADAGINISPYPDPYNMVTGIGMQNYYGQPAPQNYYGQPMMQGYYNQPMQNYYGQPAPQNYYGQPMMQNNYPQPGMYMDYNQPTYRQPLPIPGYTNPYMGIGQSYGNYYNPYTTQQQYYCSREDIEARQLGFENAAEKLVNDLNIYKMISTGVKKALGYSEEEVQKHTENIDKMISKRLDEFDNANNKRNVVGLGQYQNRNSRPENLNFHALIIRGTEIIADSDKSRRRDIGPNAVQYIMHNIQAAANEREIRGKALEYMHAHAVEREIDNEDSITFFNHGINLVHYRDKSIEWDKTMRNSRRLYDHKIFKENLIKNHGSPQDKMRYAREKARLERKKKERDKLGEIANLPGISPELQSGFRIGEDGTINITVPDVLLGSVEDRPFFKGGESEKEYNEKLENDIDYKIDEFLDRNVTQVMKRNSSYPVGFNQLPQSTSTLMRYSPTNNYEQVYDEVKRRFMNQVRQI